MFDTLRYPCAQPFSELLKATIVRCINGADTPVEREERIQEALDMRVISPAVAYALRCGDDV